LGGDLVGDLIGGFEIGNTDVSIFVGGGWSRGVCPSRGASGPAGSLPSIDVPVRSIVRLTLPSSAIWCSCLPLSEASLRSTAPPDTLKTPAELISVELS
jgi:hypothetical protein